MAAELGSEAVSVWAGRGRIGTGGPDGRPADDTVQWRAALLQLVNWGGFGGLTTVPLNGDATMISGASGVGKSTAMR